MTLNLDNYTDDELLNLYNLTKNQRDNHKLISSLKKLRDRGNTVIVVEHDKDIMKAADRVIDIGPKAGHLGGYIIDENSPDKLDESKSITAKFLKSTPPKLEQKDVTSNHHLKLIPTNNINYKNL